LKKIAQQESLSSKRTNEVGINAHPMTPADADDADELYLPLTVDNKTSPSTLLFINADLMPRTSMIDSNEHLIIVIVIDLLAQIFV
jgi:hypothetical protein